MQFVKAALWERTQMTGYAAKYVPAVHCLIASKQHVTNARFQISSTNRRLLTGGAKLAPLRWASSPMAKARRACVSAHCFTVEIRY